MASCRTNSTDTVSAPTTTVTVSAIASNAPSISAWTTTLPGNRDDAVTSVAITRQHAVYLTGSVQGEGQLGVFDKGADAFLAKMAADGHVIWKKTFPGPGTQEGRKVIADDRGVFVMGRFQGTIDLGAGPLISDGGFDVFVGRYDNSGAHQWSLSFGDSGNDMARDRDGNLVVVGYLDGPARIGAQQLRPPGHDGGSFVAKLSPTGRHLSAFVLGHTRRELASRVALDDSGDVCLIGFAEEEAPGDLSMFVARYGADGSERWTTTIDGPARQIGEVLVGDTKGNLIVAGRTQGRLMIDGNELDSHGGNDLLVAKLSSDGKIVWSRRFGGQKNEMPYAAAATPNDGVLLCGAFSGVFDFDGKSLNSDGDTALFLAEISAAGDAKRAITFNGDGQEICYAVAFHDGATYVAGTFSKQLRIGGVTHQASHAHDGFVARLPAW